MENKIDFSVGDFIVYTDRDRYVGTIKSIDKANGTAKINVVLAIRDDLGFEELVVPLSKLEKRKL